MKNGARFVLNCRYWHVAAPGEALSKYAKSSTHVKNLVEYVSTRETVSLNFSPEIADSPATDKQRELIDELKRCVNMSDKDLNEILEYNDYINNQTKQNASELIAYLQEQIIINGTFDEAENLIEYVALRPSAVRVGEHGLFSSTDNVDLKAAMKEISEHNGNIWTHILSLRREDADRLGYDSQKPWKDLIKSKIDVIAKNHNIDVSHMKWYAAMHNTGHHPHVHLFVFTDSETSKKPYLKKENIKNLKSAFATEIFRQDNVNEYVAKHEFREELKKQTDKLLKELMSNPLEHYSDENLNVLINKINTLAVKLPDKGKIYYGYQSKEVKALVNEIQRDLVYNNPILNDLYMQWCNHQYNIERNYISNPKQRPIEYNTEFTPIKNQILSQAKLIKESIISQQENLIPSIIKGSPTIEPNLSSIDNYITANGFEDNFRETEVSDQKAKTEFKSQFGLNNYLENYPEIKQLIKSEDTDTVKMFKAVNFLARDFNTRSGEVCRELGNCYNYGIGTERNVAEASMWYGIASDEYQDNIAAYRLGQIYLYGNKDIEVDENLGHYYCRNAFYGLKNEIKNSSFFNDLEEGKEDLEYIEKVSKSDAYKEYLMARMYFKGEGVSQNYEKAYKAFLLSAENGYSHAYYYIANMYYYGFAVEQDYETAFNCYQKAADGNDNYANYRLAKMYENGEGVDADLIQAEFYYSKACDKVAMANYDLANMYENNAILFEVSKEEIQNYYKIALETLIKQDSELNDSYTELRIAGMYLDGKGTEQNTDEAIKWLEKASKFNCPDANYQLGYIYSTDYYGVLDNEKSHTYYAKAIQGYLETEKNNPSSTAEHRLGKMFHLGLGTETDIHKAIKWYSISAENKNSESAYQLFNIYSQGIDVPQDNERAEYYLRLSAKGKNPKAQLRLAQLELERGNIEYGVKLLDSITSTNNADILYQLGYIYSSEQFKIMDNEKATDYYKKAHEIYLDKYSAKPNGNIAYKIGTMYHYGLGVEIKIDEAIKWYLKAIELGNEKALDKLNQATEQKQLSAMSIANTACHFGKIISTETQASFKQRYASDSKVLKTEKINKVMAGHAVDDNISTDYDY